MRTASEDDPVLIDEIRQMAKAGFGDMVKAVVDLRRGIMLLDADLPADQEAELLAQGSGQQDLWGITLPTPHAQRRRSPTCPSRRISPRR